MKSAKTRKTRRSYLQDFKKDKDGKYVYQGSWHRYQYGQLSRQKLLIRLWMMCAVLLCAAVTAGCIPAAGMDECFYVLLPYTISLVAGISVCWSLGRLSAAGERVRSYVYETSCSKIPFRSAVAAVFAGAALLGELLFLFLHHFEGADGWAVLFLALELAACASAFLIYRMASRIRWTLC